jgi:hypothetical protein
MMKHKYFGCECFCLNHIAGFGYFLPEKGEEIDEEYNDIYLTVKTDYLYHNIIPPLNPMDLGYYFRFHVLKRVPIALGYIFQKNYTRKNGIMNCFDFRIEDLSEIKEFLSNLSSEEKVDKLGVLSKIVTGKEIDIMKFCHTIDNGKWLIRFNITQWDKDTQYEFGWDLQFRPRNILGRINYALKYLFGKVDDEQNFEINKNDAEHLNGLIAVVEKVNNERTESEN